jgi:hypothetical protein
MIILLKVILYSDKKKCKPISTLIRIDNKEYQKNKKKWENKALTKICLEQNITWWNLKKKGYSKMKIVKKYK